jgi:hypothetical protein
MDEEVICLLRLAAERSEALAGVGVGPDARAGGAAPARNQNNADPVLHLTPLLKPAPLPAPT